MRTDDLAELLARNADLERVSRPSRWWSGAVVGAALATLLLMLVSLGLQPNLDRMLVSPAWWGKAGFGLAVAAAGLLSIVSLARPSGGRPWMIVLALSPLLVLWGFAVVQLLTAAPAAREALLLGRTWRECSLRVGGLSIPAFIAAILVLRQMAPTRLRAAGAAAGLFAGGIGAAVYALHCPEIEPAFVAVWYVLGVLIPVTIGVVAGRRLLSW